MAPSAHRLWCCCVAATVLTVGLKGVCGAQEPANQAVEQEQTARTAHADQSPRTPGCSPSAAEPSLGAPSLVEPAANPDGPLRIWIDEFFFAEGETVLLREAVAAAGADSAVLAGETRNRVLQLKSYQQTAKADVLWTGRLGCYEAFKRQLNATHAVSCVPGTQAVSGKARLIASLEAAYGAAAWGIVPRSFRLPQQYADMAALMKQEQRSGRSGLWVLKEDVHRGKGVGVVTPPQALVRALERAPGSSSSSGGTAEFAGLFAGFRGFFAGPRAPPRHVLAQRFLGEQLLVNGRPFYIRLWAVLLGSDPARAYLYDGGVVVFGQQQRVGQSADALIVNLWTQDRAAAAPWSLHQLEAHLEGLTGSPAAPQRLRRQLHAAVAASLAAGLPNVRRAAAALPGFQGGSFEVLGVDFLVDASLRPWLVEVNFLPSMARKLVGCSSDGGAGGSSTGGDAHISSSSGGGSSSGSGDDAEAKSGSGGGSGDGAAAGVGVGSSSSKDGAADGSSSSAGGCQQDNPFDMQKEGFVGALLGLLARRHRQLPGLQEQAEQLLQAASADASEGEAPPCLGASQLRELAVLGLEQATAEGLGFVPLTDLMYRCLACMAAQPPASSSGSSSDGSGVSCAALADLAAPQQEAAAAKQQQQQQCAAPTSHSAQLLEGVRHWGGRLLLEGASLVPWVLHPAARWRASSRDPPFAPYQLPASDRRVLSWLEQGAPQLSSPQALRNFCAVEEQGN